MRQRRVVVSGGPSAGKTTLCLRAQQRWPYQIHVVPEIPTQFLQNLPKPVSRLTLEELCELEVRMFKHQLALEEEAALTHPDAHLLCDRGTVDMLVYWPTAHSEFWKHVRSSFEIQLARYDAVLLFQSSACIGRYDGRLTNAQRYEEAPRAREVDIATTRVWSEHRQVCYFPAVDEFEVKIRESLQKLSVLLELVV